MISQTINKRGIIKMCVEIILKDFRGEIPVTHWAYKDTNLQNEL